MIQVDPGASQGWCFPCSCSSSSFMNLLVHALISLPAPSARIGAQAVSA